MARRSVATWLLLVLVGVVNGAVRQTTYGRFVGDLRAHQLSVVIGSLGEFACAYLMLRDVAGGMRDRTLALIGGAWLLGTVAFEFGFGRFVAGSSWSALLADYNLLKGRLWPVVLGTIAAAPLLVKRLGERGRWPRASAMA